MRAPETPQTRNGITRLSFHAAPFRISLSYEISKHYNVS